MRKKIVPGVCLFVFALSVGVAAQDKTDVRVLNNKTIELRVNSTKPLPRPFVAASANQIASYRLYEVETPDPEKPCVYERCIRPWTNFLNAMNGAECKDINCQLITLRLTRELPANGSFLLLINDFEAAGKPGRVSFKTDATAEIIGPWNAYDNRREFRVKANVPIQPENTVKVERTVNRLAPNSLSVVGGKKEMDAHLVKPATASAAPPRPAFLNSFRLEKKLPEGSEYDLVIPKGLSAGGQNIVAKGKVKIPGAAAAPDDPKISLGLSSSSAAKKKSVFDFTLNYTPLHNVKAGEWGETPVYFEPNIAADVGLRSTTSNNSITVFLPLTAKLELDAPYSCIAPPEKRDACKEFAASNIPQFATWSRTPWYRFAATKLSVGPKFEFDRVFKRRNVLGSMRFDFLLYRWMGTISHKRGLILKDIGEEKGPTLEGINTGLKITPYISFDVGGHVNNEKVEKELSGGQVASLIVPRHKILRGYAGFTGVIEWRLGFPMTLTLDEAVVYLGARETIGLTTDGGVELRQLRGIHPHFKTQWDIAFDPGKHYSFNVTFENGRLAPNFEYLNKMSAGIKLKY
jgi:hypothetical protein